MTTGSSVPASTPGRRFCKCEARIASRILDGYACGNSDCWRTEAARTSFAAFVADLVRTRGDAAPKETNRTDQPEQA